jgi:predicted chitinase
VGDEEDFQTISVRINGGLQGIEARKAYWRKAQAALSVS